MNKYLKHSIKLFSALMLFMGLCRFCDTQTKGFSLQEILPHSSLKPNEERAPPYIQELLSQSFTFFGVGDQSFVFLGEDQKTVLKFFKHRRYFRPRFLEPIFSSCKLAQEELQDETALLYVHLKQSKDLPPLLSLKDALGITHLINPNQTEFVLQKKATPFFSYLDEEMKQGRVLNAEQAIRSLLNHMILCCRKGIRDKDTALKRNFGFIDNRAVQIDIGTFFKDESLKDPEQGKKELITKTLRLQRWLRHHYPELLPFYLQEIGLSSDPTKG